MKGHVTHETGSPWPPHFKHSHWWKGWGRSNFATSHYSWGTIGSKGLQDGCRAHVDSCMASIGSCFMVTWTHLQKPHVGGRSNTKPGDHGTLNAHNHWFILFYHVWGHAWIYIYIYIEIAFGWGPGHIWLQTTLEDPWPHYKILEVSWDGLCTFSFGLSQFHGHNSWLVCEVTIEPSLHLILANNQSIF